MSNVTQWRAVLAVATIVSGLGLGTSPSYAKCSNFIINEVGVRADSQSLSYTNMPILDIYASFNVGFETPSIHFTYTAPEPTAEQPHSPLFDHLMRAAIQAHIAQQPVDLHIEDGGRCYSGTSTLTGIAIHPVEGQ